MLQTTISDTCTFFMDYWVISPCEVENPGITCLTGIQKINQCKMSAYVKNITQGLNSILPLYFILPNIIGSDGVTHFTSQNMQCWVLEQGILHNIHLPYWPQAAGLIELHIGFFKYIQIQLNKTQQPSVKRQEGVIVRHLAQFRTIWLLTSFELHSLLLSLCFSDFLERVNVRLSCSQWNWSKLTCTVCIAALTSMPHLIVFDLSLSLPSYKWTCWHWKSIF